MIQIINFIIKINYTIRLKFNDYQIRVVPISNRQGKAAISPFNAKNATPVIYNWMKI